MGIALVPSLPHCKGKQIQLPATEKPNTQEAGADGKESCLFSGASHLEDGGLMFQSPSPGKRSDSRLKAHLYLSAQAEVFIREERGTEQRD